VTKKFVSGMDAINTVSKTTCRYEYWYSVTPLMGVTSGQNRESRDFVYAHNDGKWSVSSMGPKYTIYDTASVEAAQESLIAMQ
jgi:hypothetical protein